MKKALIILLVAGALLTMLLVGAVAGGALAYFLTRTNPVQAAELAANPLQRAEQSANNDEGVLVSSVVEGSPAEAAGIVRGDILLAVGDTQVNSLAELHVAVEELADENDSVEITLLHGDEQRTVTVTLGDYIEQPRLGIETCGPMFGREFLPPEMRGEGFTLPLESVGALVTQVVAGSPAEAAGLQQGDVITAVDGQEITPEDNLADMIQAYQPGDELVLSVERAEADEPLELTVELGENPDDASLPYLGIRYTDNVGLFSRGERIIPFDQLPFDLPEDLAPDGDTMPFFGHPFSGEIPGLPFALPEEVQEGAIVVAVTPDSPAEEAGLQEGDVIVSAGGKAIANPQALVDIVQALEPGDELSLELYRVGESEPINLTAVLAENPDAEGSAFLGVRIGEFIRMMDDTGEPGSGFFESFPFPPSQEWAPELIEPGESA